MNYQVKRIFSFHVIVSSIVFFLAASYCQAENRTPEEILATAPDRIEQHRKGDVKLILRLPDGKRLKRDTVVEIEQTRHRFLFGCNLFKLHGLKQPEENEAYADRFAALLNFATLPFYWWSYETPQGQYRDARTEAFLQWCKANTITPKGHPLAWNYVDPKWLPDDVEAVTALQFGYIDRSIRRFKNDLEIWDVVNEATHYDREETLKQAPKLSRAIETMGRGPYLRQAFTTARKANPDALLLINDYRTGKGYEDDVLAELVDEHQQPLYDAIGIQSHMHTGYWGADHTWGVCERFAKYGKPLHFTEATMVSGALKEDYKTTPTPWLSTPEGEKKQARQVAEFYTVLFSHPAVEAITWWDFSDQGAWQGAPAGLLRKDMTPKPAYNALMDLIKGKWWTRLETRTGFRGKLKFRGFYGEYRATVNLDGQVYQAAFTLEPGGVLPLTVPLRPQ